jgi:hypothetical protein
LLLGLIVTGNAQAQSTATPPVKLPQFEGRIAADDVRPHITYLASPELRGRAGRDAVIAGDYIALHFRKCGLQPLFGDDGFFQPIPGKPGENGEQRYYGRNVGAWVPGSDPKLRNEFVIISAHYDHLGTINGEIYRGADDNASGVSMLLEVARQVASAKVKPRRSIVFIAFDLEEHMLWGSRWFAAHPPWPLEQVKLFITADMIGRSLGNLPLATVFVLGSEHAPELKHVLDEVGQPNGLEVARLGVDLVGTRSDYGPFRDRKIPFLFFSTGEHPDYHSPRDVPEKIDYEKVARVSSLVYGLTTRVADDDAVPVWADEFEPDVDEARSLNRIASMLLKAGGDKQLTDLQRFVVSHAETKTKQIVERGSMTAGERTWLISVSQILLLSVF